MKRKIWGLIAVALALSLSAFTSFRPERKTGSYYWFALDSFSGMPLTTSTLIYQPADPYNCANWGPYGYCVGAFTSYTGSSGAYEAAGVEVMIHSSLYP